MESSLSLKLSDLEGEVGLFLGLGRGADNGDSAWTTSQQAAITSCVRSGLRQFYYPPPLEGQAGAYDWSFLRPEVALELASGEEAIDLPDDFGGLEGQVTITQTDSTSAWWPLGVTNPDRVRQRQAAFSTQTGTPILCAISWLRGTGPTQGQRAQLVFSPTSDQAYTTRFQYYVLADALSGAFPYALGGMAHAETILESCLAIAEQRLDDAMSVHSFKFRERLAASISLDRRNKPQSLGYNGDRSDGRSWYGRSGMHGWPSGVTFDGVEP